jgi:hypothetical protein
MKTSTGNHYAGTVMNICRGAVNDEVERSTNKMEFSAIRRNGQVYVAVIGGQIQSEQDGIALVSACAEHDTNLLLLPVESLSDDFLRLSSRVAGLVLQKLINYNIKTAAVFDTKQLSKRFQEFVSESNKGQVFRVYTNLTDAESWLLEG